MTAPSDAAHAAAARAALARLLPAWTGIAEVEFLPGGYSNDNFRFSYDGTAYVLRIPLREQPFVDRGHEAAWYAGLPPSMGVQPVAFDAATGLMVTPWVEGELLVDVFRPQDEGQLPAYLHQLHSALPDTERVYALPELITRYLDGGTGALPATARAALSAAGEAATVTCHNDLNPWNIMVTGTGWVTLDWEFVGRNDPLFDLVNLHQGLELPPDNLAGLAREYLMLSNDASVDDPAATAARLQQAFVLYWLREYSWARYQLSVGNVRPEIEEQVRLAWTRLAG